jgi:hypothetical protein
MEDPRVQNAWSPDCRVLQVSNWLVQGPDKEVMQRLMYRFMIFSQYPQDIS